MGTSHDAVKSLAPLVISSAPVLSKVPTIMSLETESEIMGELTERIAFRASPTSDVNTKASGSHTNSKGSWMLLHDPGFQGHHRFFLIRSHFGGME